MADQPLVVFVEPKGARHQHAEFVARAGFRVATTGAADVDVGRVLQLRPAVIAAELDGAESLTTLNVAKRFRQSPEARQIPFVIYGHHLRPRDIEDTARAGALWLQLEPDDGARLLAAVRGLIAASSNERVDTVKAFQRRESP